jgi:hypothetical protein
MGFIEGKLFQDKRSNFTVYEMLPIDFYGTESWWYWSNVRSSPIREQTWQFTIGSSSILFAQSRDVIYWMDALPR